jgi:hypothetical protein
MRWRHGFVDGDAEGEGHDPVGGRVPRQFLGGHLTTDRRRWVGEERLAKGGGWMLGNAATNAQACGPRVRCEVPPRPATAGQGGWPCSSARNLTTCGPRCFGEAGHRRRGRPPAGCRKWLNLSWRAGARVVEHRVATARRDRTSRKPSSLGPGLHQTLLAQPPPRWFGGPTVDARVNVQAAFADRPPIWSGGHPQAAGSPDAPSPHRLNHPKPRQGVGSGARSINCPRSSRSP